MRRIEQTSKPYTEATDWCIGYPRHHSHRVFGPATYTTFWLNGELIYYVDFDDL